MSGHSQRHWLSKEARLPQQEIVKDTIPQISFIQES